MFEMMSEDLRETFHSALPRTCVAVMTGFPAKLHFWIIIFWARKIFSVGISIPRSPRATFQGDRELRSAYRASINGRSVHVCVLQPQTAVRNCSEEARPPLMEIGWTIKHTGTRASLYTYVMSHHDGVGLLEDGVEILDPFLVLNLRGRGLQASLAEDEGHTLIACLRSGV